MGKLLACPICETDAYVYVIPHCGMEGKFACVCNVCGAGTGACDTEEEAEEKWNILVGGLSAEPENKPLTLEQLRQIDGEPVWIVESKNGKQDSSEQWQKFAYEEPKYNLMAFWEFGDEVENTYDIAEYGKTWLAYARKPEQEEKQ